MFLDKFAFHLNPPIATFSDDFEFGQKVYLYKVRRGRNSKPYIIRREVFQDDVNFIKFYPSRMENNPNKYKHRNDKKNYSYDFTRLVVSCIKLINSIKENCPESIFAFFGQWDEEDQKRNNQYSQRYTIYKKVLVSKAKRENFVHIDMPGINSYALVPVEIYSKELQDKLVERFENLLGKKIEDLRIPGSR